MFSGSDLSVPAGWVLCDGRTVTINGVNVTSPDLRGRFVLGFNANAPASNTNNSSSRAGPNSLGSVSGEYEHTLSVTEMPSHTHSTNVNAPSLGLVQRSGSNTALAFDSSSGELDLINAASLNIGYTGNNNAHNNMPPYYVLCFIMKGF